jgi:hypothetical protein
VRTGQRRGRPLLVRAGTVQARGSLEPPGAARPTQGDCWVRKCSEQLLRPPPAPPLRRPASCPHRPRGPAPVPPPTPTWSAQARPCPAQHPGLRPQNANAQSGARSPCSRPATPVRARARAPYRRPSRPLLPPSGLTWPARVRAVPVTGSGEGAAGAVRMRRPSRFLRHFPPPPPPPARCAREEERRGGEGRGGAGRVAQLRGHRESPTKKPSP